MNGAGAVRDSEVVMLEFQRLMRVAVISIFHFMVSFEGVVISY